MGDIVTGLWSQCYPFEFRCEVPARTSRHNIEAAVQDVKSVCWHPSGELLVSCSYDDSIKLWTDDGGEWICTQTLEGKMLCQMLDAKSVVQVVCDCSCLLFRPLNQVFSRWLSLSPNKAHLPWLFEDNERAIWLTLHFDWQLISCLLQRFQLPLNPVAHSRRKID